MLLINQLDNSVDSNLLSLYGIDQLQFTLFLLFFIWNVLMREDYSFIYLPSFPSGFLILFSIMILIIIYPTFPSDFVISSGYLGLVLEVSLSVYLDFSLVYVFHCRSLAGLFYLSYK